MFVSLKLIKPLQKALEKEMHHTPTPIQQEAIPVILQGKDLLGFSQTGTGKTAAFLLPILQLISKDKRRADSIQALILVPTRELALQTGEYAYRYGRYLTISHAVIYGGVPHQEQIELLKGEVNLLIATPGRLLELLKRNSLRLDRTSILVLDEADRMLDMGFMPDIRQILSYLPAKKQSLLFSATMPPLLSLLADSLLHDPQTILITPTASVTETILQKVLFTERNQKEETLIQLLKLPLTESAIIFLNSRKGVDRLFVRLKKAGFETGVLHSDLKQGARNRIVADLKNRRIRFLISTDIAARGIDIENLSHVINYEMPLKAENYVHRIGRTGRAGKQGIAISLCDKTERKMLREIEQLIGGTLRTE
ncbi:MAG: DEAD/DEAH box helicase [Bacteroidales bacterium]